MRTSAAAAAFVFLAACSPSEGTPGTASEGKECAATVHVFTQAGTTPQRERRIGQVIDNAPGVLEWSFHSSREAYRDFKKLYEKEPEIYEAKQPSEFPSRYEVTLESSGDYELFERTLEGATTGIDRLVPGGCASPEPSS